MAVFFCIDASCKFVHNFGGILCSVSWSWFLSGCANMDNCWNLFYLFILSFTSGSIWRTLNQLRSKLQDPGRVDISTWFLHVGTKSIAFYLEIFTTRPLIEIAFSRQLAAACCQGLVKQYILLTAVGEYCQQGPHLVETADLLSYWPFILCL